MTPLAHNRPKRGFTLVEMLTVVGVITLLLGLLLPALSSVRTAGKKTAEFSAARQLMMAYQLYANNNKDQVLPGYKDGLRAVDSVGRSIAEQTTPFVAARYPWRIAPYLDYQFRGLYTNDQEWELEAMEQVDHETYMYVVSLYPSLGLNATWVGGNQNELGFNGVAMNAYGRFYISSTSEARRSDSLIVFASARAEGVDLESGDTLGMTEGYFEVRSPILTASGGDRWVEQFHHNVEPGDFGYISPRYQDASVIAFMDGHVDLLGVEEIRDMRHWSRDATCADWGLTPDQ
ncbi:MAG: type II secretion system protein [Planctomycetota bacterium]|jgi:prepilin-type N-terminal cleavage/methylation domain-containing protein